MRFSLPLLFEGLHAVALALWLGGAAAFMVLASVGAAAASRLFVVREQAVIETAAIVMVAVQYLTRRRYKNNRSMYIVDGLRHVFTFGALIIAVYFISGVKGRSIGVLDSAPAALATSAGQILMLIAVSVITIWLYAASSGANSAVPVTQSGKPDATPGARKLENGPPARLRPSGRPVKGKRG